MKFREEVLPVMRQIRALVLPRWGNARIIHQKDNSAVNVVTQLDLDVEDLVSKQLRKIYPDIGFVGEEHGGDREAKKFWLMDPIDGTGHFIRGLPFCTSMLALIQEGSVVCSAVYDFINDRMYWAEKDKGAFCEETRLSVSNRSLSEAYIGWETNLDRKENEAFFHALRNTDFIAANPIIYKELTEGSEAIFPLRNK